MKPIMHSEKLFIKDFFYELPEEYIAKYPLPQRDESRLLIYKHGDIKEDTYFHLDKYIPSSSLLIFNNTKVVEARLLFKKSTGSTIELFCLEPGGEYADIAVAMSQKGKVIWKCLAGTAKKWKEEPMIKMIQNDLKEIKLTARKIKKEKDYLLVELSWSDDSLSFAELLHIAGAIPLPPYINREPNELDKERYQTIYAKYEGSVAAPTAGLHFTERLFRKLEAKNIYRDFVTLHVGAGTFKPVKSDTIKEHEMHAEYIEVRKGLIESLLSHLHTNIIAVGSTSLRTLESLYWLGVKTIIDPEVQLKDLLLHQWEAYELKTYNISIKQSLHGLLKRMDENQTEILITKTQLIITPGYNLKVVNALITNFHQPQSTLLLLVAALVPDWKKIYDYALANNFRFLSYGDGNLIWKEQK